MQCIDFSGREAPRHRRQRSVERKRRAASGESNRGSRENGCAVFGDINPCGICEIRLRRVKYGCAM